MSIEFLVELEKKVDMIIKKVEQLRLENNQLKGELEKKNNTIIEQEKELGNVKNESEALKSDTQERFNAAAEKIKGLIAKIDAV